MTSEMSALRRLTSALALAAVAGCASAPSADPAPQPAGVAEGRLVLMGTTDLHGWVLPYDYYTGQRTDNGLAALVPLIDSVRAANPERTVLVESGDLLQGNAMDFVYRSLAEREEHPLVRAMNLVGYDAAAIGNHEFNYGIAHLDRAAAGADFPFISANIFRAGTPNHAYRPYTMVERTVGGRTVRIGIAAVTPPGVLIWDRDNVQGRLDFREIVGSVRPVVAEMRQRGADIVMIAAHSGFEGSSYDTAATGVPTENASSAMAREIPGVDVIFMGHTHREVADTTINGVLVQQAKNWGTSLAVAELDLRWDGGRWTVGSKRGRILRLAPGSTSPLLEAALAEAHERTRAYVAQVIGTSDAEWTSALARTRDTPILDLINDVQMRVTGAELSAASAFSLTSRIPQGPVTVADVAGLYVYDNTLKAIRISGAQLRAYLEKSAEYYLPCPASACETLTNPSIPGYNYDVVSGVDYTLDLTKPVGQRLTRLERNGRAVMPADSFTIAINNYRASGSGGFSMLIGAPVVYDRGEGIRDLLIEDIRRRGTLRPADVFRQSWEIVPAALAERAAVEQRPSTAPGGEAHGGTTPQRPRP
jgi:2',3'-cyclic-nucleotide 2'-phosphodiesterase (5'-nucleotidase family)